MTFWPLVAFGIAMVVRYYLRDEPGGAAPRPRMLLAGALPAECLGARPRRIESAEPGELVAVYGTVVSEPTLTSLARRRACVAYDVVLVDELSDKQLERTLAAEPFVIADASGQALVDPRGAYLRFDPVEATAAELARAKAAEPALFADLPAKARVVAHEGVLLKGWKVLVIGVVAEASDVEASAYRAAGELTVRIAGGGKHAALVSTRDADRATFGGAL